jgi:hypothetical protein
MQYHVSRNGQTYGPYTLEDLQRYVTSGNVLPTDLAKGDDMPDWLPVAQILNIPGQVAAPAPPPFAAVPGTAYPAAALQYPDPPNLNWILVLLFGFLTCGVFTLVYDLIQILWLRRIKPDTKVLIYYIIFIALEFLNLGGSFSRMVFIQHGTLPPMSGSTIALSIFSLFVSIGVLVMYIVLRFTMRSELEQHFNGPEPLGLRLSGVMTFFFGGLYFQYHFNRLNEIKQGLRYRAASR